MPCFCVFKMEEDPFNPDYVEVDRVLEVSYCQDKDSGEVTNCVFSGDLSAFGEVGLCFVSLKASPCVQPVVYYLVKWCSLPYEDSTWELNEDVDQTKIEEFKQLQAVKPNTNRLVRPSLSSIKISFIFYAFS